MNFYIFHFLRTRFETVARWTCHIQIGNTVRPCTRQEAAEALAEARRAHTEASAEVRRSRAEVERYLRDARVDVDEAMREMRADLAEAARDIREAEEDACGECGRRRTTRFNRAQRQRRPR